MKPSYDANERPAFPSAADPPAVRVPSLDEILSLLKEGEDKPDDKPVVVTNFITEHTVSPDPDPEPSEAPEPTPGFVPDPDPELTPGAGTDPDPTPGGSTDPDPTPGGGTDPDPTPGGGTDPDPTPGGGIDPDPDPEPDPEPSVTPVVVPTIDPGSGPEPSVPPDPGGGGDDFNDYTVPDLRRVFPFCIPFDLVHLMEVLDAEPEPPKFEFPVDLELNNPWSGKKVVDYHKTFVLDFADFEPVVKILRILEVVLFIAGLMMITRQHMIKG